MLGHLIGDFVLQPYWLVLAKRTGWPGLFIHVGVVTFVTAGGSCSAANVNGWTISNRRFGSEYLTFESVTGGGTTKINTNDDLATNQWQHVAVVRNGSSLKLYIDGVEKGSGTNNDNIQTTSELVIGSCHEKDDRYVTGYIDELRISKGIARWTEEFTPESGPYTE